MYIYIPLYIYIYTYMEVVSNLNNCSSMVGIPEAPSK